MLLKLLKSKRGLSPVISAVLLMALMIAAIAVSLGIVYPMVRKLDDSIGLISTATSINALDDDIKQLIVNGKGSITSRNIEIGITGSLLTDTKSYSVVYLNYLTNGINPQNIFTNYEKHNRFIVSQILEGDDALAKNTHSYIEGNANQGQFFLNNTDKATIPWGILNQSRLDTENVNSSISYRGLISTQKSVDAANSIIYLTISFQMIDLDFPDSQSSSGSNQFIQMKYHSLNVTRTNYFSLLAGIDPQLIYLRIDTYLQGNPTTIEYPFAHEVPKNSGEIKVRFEFITHQVSISF